MNGLSLLLWVIAGLCWGIGFVLNSILCGHVFHNKDIPVVLAGLALAFSVLFPVFGILGLCVAHMLRVPVGNTPAQGTFQRLVVQAEPIRNYYSHFARSDHSDSDDSESDEPG
jgi:hypothetical protein